MKNFIIVAQFLVFFLCFSNDLLFAQADKFVKNIHTFHGQTIPYQLFVPDTLEPGVNYPLILALHGSGERGDDNTHVERSPYLWSWSRDTIQQEHPCFVLAPQCPERKDWMFVYYVVTDIIDSLRYLYPIDSTRNYIIGYSMGGRGSWSYVFKYPLRFAAAVPCSATDRRITSMLEYISHVPAIWSYHGAQDNTVPVEWAREVVDSMIVNGLEVIKTQDLTDNELDDVLATNPSNLYTEYPDGGHNIHRVVFFDNPRLVEWLFNQHDPNLLQSDPVYPTNTAVQSSAPPIEFPYHSSQPVFSYGFSGAWDDAAIRWPAVIQDGDTLRMWYTGNRPEGLTASIGYAWSVDGSTWHRYSSNPVLSPTFEWEGMHIGAGCVINDNGEYKMWYAGNLKGGWTTVTGFATSSDGINWTKHPAPVLLPGSEDDWDYINIWPGTVIKEGNQYTMWYEGGSWLTHYQIGLATSTDGITWVKYNDIQTIDAPYENSDPVISFRSSWGDWEAAGFPTVIKKDNEYKMLYLGFDLDTQLVYYASSEDGVNWIKYADYPVLDQSPQWTEVTFYDNGTFLETVDGRLHFWYTSYMFNSSGYISQPQIGYAADYKDLPIVRSFELDRTFISTDIDTVKIKTKIENKIGHNIDVRAKFYNDNIKVNEYAQLYDDGEHGDDLAQDSIYGGSWMCTDENTFNSIIEINDLSNGFTYNSYIPFDLKEQVTAIGPIVLKDYVIGYQDEDLMIIKITLENLGANTTASNVTAKITSDDTCVTDIQDQSESFGNIAAGSSQECSGTYNIYFDPDCSGDNLDPIHLKVNIYSNGYHFWTDSTDLVSAISDIDNKLPSTFSLSQNSPNPFNPSTKIKYQLPKVSEVELSIYNLLGQKVVTLVSERQQAGYFQVEWNAGQLASGIYYYLLKTSEFQDAKKMILIK